MNVKLFILILVVLALACLTGVAVGIGQDDDAPANSDAPDWLENLGELIPQAHVTSEDVVRADPLSCLSGERLRLAAGQTCQYRLAPAGRSRVLDLAVLAGEEVLLALQQPVKEDGSPLTAEAEARAGQRLELDIHRRQSDNDLILLAVACRGGDDCLLEIR